MRVYYVIARLSGNLVESLYLMFQAREHIARFAHAVSETIIGAIYRCTETAVFMQISVVCRCGCCRSYPSSATTLACLKYLSPTHATTTHTQLMTAVHTMRAG
jgi:hypothetical protein